MATVRRILVDVDANRRIVLYPQGGMDLEARVEGIGWVLDNGAEVSDSVLAAHMADAKRDVLAILEGQSMNYYAGYFEHRGHG